MKRRTPGGIWALRGVTVAIAVAVVLVVGSVAYSAYEDYSAVRSELTGGPNQAVGKAVQNGNTASVLFDVPIANGGLYTLDVTVSCDGGNPNVVCASGHVSVPPGQRLDLRFNMTVLNIQQYAAGDRRINGTVAISLEPFASLSLGVVLGGLISLGGS